MSSLAATAALGAASTSPRRAEDRVGELRQDVRLVPGPREAGGAPTWQLVDPLRHQYFRLGWQEFECLARWRLGNAEAIAAAVRRDTTLQVEAADVLALARFLGSHRLLILRQPPGAPTVPAWQRQFAKLVYHRIPLWQPQAALDRALPWLGWLWRPASAWVAVALGVWSLWALGARASEITTDLARYANEVGVLLGFAVLAVTKTLHEFGHGLACRRHGVRVPAMGIALVFVWPMPYVDTSDAWRVLDRHARLEIALAGVATELLLAITASFAWLYLDPGLARDVCLFVAVLSWSLSLLVNLNPLMRFDGYYALVDMTGYDNLQTRALAWLRHRVHVWFGIDAPAPEHATGARARLFLAYGAASALYRVSIYVGVSVIAWAVLPHAIALPLLLAGWWVLAARPLQRDAEALRARWQPGHDGGANAPATKLRPRRGVLAVLVLAGLALLYFALPLPRVVVAPAVYSAAQVHALHVPEDADWLGWRVTHGAQVRRGHVLATLRSPELERDIARQEATVADLGHRFALRGSGGPGMSAAGGVGASAEELESAQRALDALLLRRERLQVRAPVDGRVYFEATDLGRARALPADLQLAVVVGGAGVVQAFVGARDHERLDPRADASFYDDACTPGCAPIPAQRRRGSVLDGQFAIAPRLRGFATRDDAAPVRMTFTTHLAPPAHERYGTVRLRTEPTSELGHALQRVLGVARRELGL